jgi:hypothetical protein
MTTFQREEVKDHLTRLFAALSATNEAIMRAKTRPEQSSLRGGWAYVAKVTMDGAPVAEVVPGDSSRRQRSGGSFWLCLVT